MTIVFDKYQGNGNDFIIIDGINEKIKLSPEKIRFMCDRHFGIGADGLIILKPDVKSDFKMMYYNSDGHLASMCGNGARCTAAFAFERGFAAKAMIFKAYDGNHEAHILHANKDKGEYDVSLSMGSVKSVEKNKEYYFLNTGSPHYVEFVEKVAEINVVEEGRKTRFSEKFTPDGTNVNFVEINGDRLFVRTYERGVEDETLSCGTGVTASALAAFLETKKKDFRIHTTGGDFKVDFTYEGGHFHSIWLKGPAKFVYHGKIKL